MHLKTQLPTYTLFVLVMSTLAYVLPDVASLLVFDRSAIFSGEVWRIVTGSLVHFTSTHFVYDVLAFAAAGFIIEYRRYPGSGILYVVMALSIGVSLMVLEPEMHYYGGLSGLACGSVAYLALYGLREKSYVRLFSAAMLVFLALKISFELYTGQSVMGDNGQEVFVIMPISHLVGALSAVAVFIYIECFSKRKKAGGFLKHLVIALILSVLPINAIAQECVVLLHGLARTSLSMNKLEEALTRENYTVANIDYPSREKRVEDLAELAVKAGLDQCRKESASPVNIVTHSLGGILVRQYLKEHKMSDLKRVVMLGPPNAGSELVDKLRDVAVFNAVNGPAASQIGTSSHDIPATLGPVNFELGVIAGTRSVNPVLSTVLPDPDDGKVSVESAKIKGMCAFIELPVTHTFMMRNDEAIRQVLYFLEKGIFDSEKAISGACVRSRYTNSDSQPVPGDTYDDK